MSDDRTVVLVDGQGDVVGSITFASSTFLDALTQMMVAGCQFQFSGGFVRNSSQPPKMVEARIVPRCAALRRGAIIRESRTEKKTTKTPTERENAFRRDLAELLAKHKAELEITDDGKGYGMHGGIAVVTMASEWDEAGNQTAEHTEFRI